MIVAVSLSIVFAFAMTSAYALEENGVIDIPFTENQPAIDGKWTNGNEWEDSSQTLVENNEHRAFIHLMHDRDYIYVLADYVSDQTQSGTDFVLVCFDTDNDGGSSFDSDDYCFVLGEKISPVYAIDPLGKLQDLKDASMLNGKTGFSSENSPNESGRDHRIQELSIPISFLHKQDSYGFFIEVGNVQEKQGIAWPQNLSFFTESLVPHPPSTWGTIKSSENTVTAPPVPFISISTKSISFGNEEVSDKTSRSVTISNKGTGLLKVSNIRTSGHFSVSNIDPPVDLLPSQSFSFDAVFAPLSIGEKSGSITISSNDLSSPTYTISVKGTGIEKGASPISGGGGCLIATAIYGTELAPQVQQLRELRDNTLLQTDSGSSFMNEFNEFYYLFSPAIADLERQSPIFKEFVKLTIIPLLTTLSILNYADIDSEEEMLWYGTGVILLNIGIYFGTPVFGIILLRRDSDC